jgi:glutaredoxin
MRDVSLLVLSSPGCTHCRRFLEFWEKHKGEWGNVTMREVSVLYPEGQALAQKHMIFASPGIILNDELYESGGFDEKSFIEKLTALSKE